PHRALPPFPTRRSSDLLAERHARRDEMLKMNYEYIMGWETDNAEGLRGAFDPQQRDKELDADGVAAEVIFPDADAITGMAGPPLDRKSTRLNSSHRTIS